MAHPLPTTPQVIEGSVFETEGGAFEKPKPRLFDDFGGYAHRFCKAVADQVTDRMRRFEAKQEKHR